MAKSKGKGKRKGGKKGKKGGGDGEKKKKLKAVPEGLALNEMTKKQLRKHVLKLFIEIDRERVERNFFMLERDKQFLLWNLVLEQISQEKDRARLLEVHYDDTERDKDKEMNIWKQKLRHMMGEQTEKLAKARMSNLYKMKRIQDEIWEIYMMLRDGMLEKHRQWRAMEASKYGLLQNLVQGHQDEITTLRQQFADEVKRMSEATEREAAMERKRVDNANSQQLATLRAKKEEQIEQMLYMHEKQLLEMKTFFNDLEVNNMAVITSLQQEIVVKKLNERRLQRTLKEIKDKHQGLLVPIENFETKMIEWADDEKEMERVRKEIAKGERQLAQNQQYISLMSCANESLLQKTRCIDKERNALRRCFTQSVLKNHMKGTMGRIVTGFKQRAADAGYITAVPEDDECNVANARKKGVCKALQPLFDKSPFAFNECIFPDPTQEPHPYCRPIQWSPQRRSLGPSFICDAPQRVSEQQHHFLPPLTQPRRCIRPANFTDE